MPSLHGEVEARALLELLWLVEPRERRVLILVGEGEQVSEVARCRGLPIGTAFSQGKLSTQVFCRFNQTTASLALDTTLLVQSECGSVSG